MCHVSAQPTRSSRAQPKICLQSVRSSIPKAAVTCPSVLSTFKMAQHREYGVRIVSVPRGELLLSSLVGLAECFVLTRHVAASKFPSSVSTLHRVSHCPELHCSGWVVLVEATKLAKYRNGDVWRTNSCNHKVGQSNQIKYLGPNRRMNFLTLRSFVSQRN